MAQQRIFILTSIVLGLAACNTKFAPPAVPAGGVVKGDITVNGQGHVNTVSTVAARSPELKPDPFGVSHSPVIGGTGASPGTGGSADPNRTPDPSSSGKPASADPGGSGASSPNPKGSQDPNPVPSVKVSHLPDPETSATPTQAPSAADIIYLGAYKASLLAGGTIGRPAPGVGALAVLGQSILNAGMTIESTANKLWFTDARGGQVRNVDLTTQNVLTVQGDPDGRTTGTDPAVAYMELDAGLAYDKTRKAMYVSDGGHARLYRLNLTANTLGKPDNSFDIIAGGIFATLRDGPGSGDGVDDTNRATFATPQGMTIFGNALYVVDADGFDIRKVDLTSSNLNVTMLAKGNTNAGKPTLTDTYARTDSRFGLLAGICVSLDGKTMYVADQGNNMIRAIDLSSSTGKVSVFAGTLTSGFKDGAAGTAQFKQPMSLAVDKDFLYVGELDNRRVRAISLADRSTKTLVGKVDAGATTGNKDVALFTHVTGITCDLDANGAAKALYVYDPGSDAAGARIVKIVP
ncbi:MAG: hypothetical protein JWM80_3467 [Cyanobacteria bacterium RYN_339]|nr:hypothetical protein [Cyanobacteria bacterium RYN_339]